MRAIFGKLLRDIQMKKILVLLSLTTILSAAHAQIPNFPKTLCSISYGGNSQSPQSQFPGAQGVVGSDDNYVLQVLFSSTSAEVRITDKKLGQVLVVTPATSDLGTFQGPIGVVSTTTGRGVYFNCAALKVQTEQNP
jgi:hypothetical protein